MPKASSWHSFHAAQQFCQLLRQLPKNGTCAAAVEASDVHLIVEPQKGSRSCCEACIRMPLQVLQECSALGLPLVLHGLSTSRPAGSITPCPGHRRDGAHVLHQSLSGTSTTYVRQQAAAVRLGIGAKVAIVTLRQPNQCINAVGFGWTQAVINCKWQCCACALCLRSNRWQSRRHFAA